LDPEAVKSHERFHQQNEKQENAHWNEQTEKKELSELLKSKKKLSSRKLEINI
jgi:hypothetical protein